MPKIFPIIHWFIFSQLELVIPLLNYLYSKYYNNDVHIFIQADYLSPRNKCIENTLKYLSLKDTPEQIFYNLNWAL